MPQPNRLKALLFTALSFVVALVISFAAAEAIVRLKNASMKDYNTEMWRYARELKFPSPDPRLGHEHIANAHALLQSVDIRTNAWGLRGGPVSDAPAPGTRRIHYELAGRAEGRETGMSPNDWSEALYLSIYPDVTAEVRRGTFASGYHHYLVAGRAEGRDSGVPPSGNTWPPIPPPAPASRWANIKPATRTTPPWDGSKDCWEDYPPPIPWKDCGCTGRS